MANFIFDPPGQSSLIDGLTDQPDEIHGNDGADTLRGNGAGPGEADSLFGDAGNDVLVAGASADIADGGPDDDLIEPGGPGAGPGGNVVFDTVIGGAGTDTLVLRGQPQDYAFTFDAARGGYVVMPRAGASATEHAVVAGIEQVTFGVDAIALRQGALPTARADFLDLQAVNGNQPTVARDDLVRVAPGATAIVIDIAALLANDIDPEGDPFGFGTLTYGSEVASLIIADAGTLATYGLRDADHPRGALLIGLANPFAGTLPLSYRPYDQARSSYGTAATITLAEITQPGVARNDILGGTAGGADLIRASLLTANDDPGVTITGLAGVAGSGTQVLNLGNGTVIYEPGSQVFSIFPTGGLGDTLVFRYAAVDVLGNASTATVQVDVTNRNPVAFDRIVPVLPGVTTTILLSDLATGGGNFDPDGDPLILASYQTLVDPALGSFVYAADRIAFTPTTGYTGGATLGYGILDAPPNWIGQRDSAASARLIFTLDGPAPVAADDGSFLATIGRAGSLAGNRVLANDSGTGLSILGLLDNRGTADPGDDQVVSRLTTAQGTLIVLRTGTPAELGATDGSTASFDLQPFGTLLNQAPAYAGPDRFTYVVQDSLGRQARANVSLDFANHLPVAVDDTLTLAGGGALRVPIADILANDTDPDPGQVLRLSGYVVQNLAGEGRLDADPSDPNVLVYTPRSPSWSGSESFRYFITDRSDPTGALSGYANALITFTVLGAPAANRAPAAVADSYIVQEGRILTVAAPGLLANDSDPDGDAISATSFFQPANGTVRVVTNGALTYTPNPDFVGTDSFTYILSDGTATTNGTVTVTVVEGNPIGVADRYSVAAGQSLLIDAPGVLANDSDPNGDALIVVALSAAAHGTTNLVTNGKLTYTPDPGFVGQDSFAYVISDGVLRSGLIPITIDVTNAPPLAGADSYTVQAGRTLTVASPGLLANDSDPDGNALSVTGVFQPANGTVRVVTNGALTYTPNVGFVGTDSFTYILSDGTTTSNGTATIVVVPNTSADLSVSLAIGAAEVPAGDTADVVVRVDNAGPASGGGTVQLTPGLGVRFLGGSETFDPVSGVWTLGPIAAGGFAELAIETLFATAGTPDIIAELVTASNPDPDSTPGNGIARGEDDAAAASVAVTVPPASVALQAATIGSTPEGNAPAPGALAFTILRSGNLDIASTVRFTLGAGPGETVTSDDIATVADGGTGLGTGLGDYAVTFAPGEASRTIAVISTGDRTPEADESIRLTLTGATGATLSTTGPLSATGLFADDDFYPTVGFALRSVGVVPEGDEPSAGGVLGFTLTRTGDLGYRSVLTLSVFLDLDSSNDDLARITWGGNGLGATTGDYEIAFAPGQASGLVTVAARGDRLPEPTSVVVLELTPVANVTTNPATDTVVGGFQDDDAYPTIGWSTTDAGAVLEGTAPGAGGTLDFTIIRSGDLSYASTARVSVAGGAGGTTSDDIATVALGGSGLGSGFGTYSVSFASGQASATISIRAAADRIAEADEGVVLTLLSATEGELVASEARVAAGRFLNDDVPNLPPIATDDLRTVLHGRVLSLPAAEFLANDRDPENAPLTVLGFGGAAHGSVSYDTTTLTYTPSSRYAGPDAFRYLISDGTNTALGTIRVTVVNTAPVALDDRYQLAPGQVLAVAGGGVLDNDRDAEGDALAITSYDAVSAAGGTVALAPNGTFTYTPPAGFRGDDSFTYTISDGLAADTSTVFVNVVNSTPVAGTDGPYESNPGVPLNIDAGLLLANDSDRDGDALSVTAVGDAVGGSVALVGTTVVFRPSPGFIGVGSFTYAVSDPYGGQALGLARIEVAAQLPAGGRPIVGGPGNDVLTSEGGDDALVGNGGWDVAAFGGARPAVTFTYNADGSITATGPDGTDTLRSIEAARFASGSPLALRPAGHDLTNDGAVDLLWRHATDGALVAYTLDKAGAVVAAPSIGVIPTAWRVAATGDLNGDGRADLVWQNSATGLTTGWLMDGTTVIGNRGFGDPGVAWRIEHLADLDGDGNLDIVWRNTTDGAVVTSLLDGNGVPTSVPGIGVVGLDWKIVAAADLNSDGRSELVWQNQATGLTTVFTMDGATVTGSIGLGDGGAAWRIQDVADLDGNGTQDVIWRNTASDEMVGVLLDVAGAATRSASIGVARSGDRFVGTADLNGDTRTDILWQAASGAVEAWLMNGLSRSGSLAYAAGDGDWTLLR